MQNNETQSLEILCTCIELERNAYNFYSKAAHRSTNPEGKKVFAKLAEREKSHARSLENRYKHILKEKKCPVTKIKPTILVEETIVDKSMSDLEVLELALKDEEQAYHYYVKSAESTDDLKSREILLDLAKDEIEHRQVLTREIERISKKSA